MKNIDNCQSTIRRWKRMLIDYRSEYNEFLEELYKLLSRQLFRKFNSISNSQASSQASSVCHQRTVSVTLKSSLLFTTQKPQRREHHTSVITAVSIATKVFASVEHFPRLKHLVQIISLIV
ncbi:CLUMA_CG000790, isoform A [Clunio marinus]|uniref:CLUMA_CG000790, isoform A n=1 Tax=Clunio marinus TaxID=568069 RepID=A0A1J1HL66_9DIPT|nr:CLUMA_CG000790, isoform A [Clunio marinus]